jgi:hypothetical protein
MIKELMAESAARMAAFQKDHGSAAGSPLRRGTTKRSKEARRNSQLREGESPSKMSSQLRDSQAD